MALLLKQRDYVPDENGGVTVVRDGDELLSEVLFRLTARRGSFPFLPGLGSRMWELRREKQSDWKALARQFAVEALAELKDVTVADAEVYQEGETLWVTVKLLWQGTDWSVTAQVEG